MMNQTHKLMHCLGISTKLRVIALILQAGIASGCKPNDPNVDGTASMTPHLGTDEGTYGYVLRMGDAAVITEWTLTQVDNDRIYDGMEALGSFVARNRTDQDKVRSAEAGMMRIYDKLVEGWPGYTGINRHHDADAIGPLSPQRRQVSLDRQIAIVYDLFLDVPDVPKYLALKPDPNIFPARYKDWWNRGKLYKVKQMNEYPAPQDLFK